MLCLTFTDVIIPGRIDDTVIKVYDRLFFRELAGIVVVHTFTTVGVVSATAAQRDIPFLFSQV